MNLFNLAKALLSQEEQGQMQDSIQLLEAGQVSRFYRANAQLVYAILFLENEEEFLDFSRENRLDKECFCAAFLCAKGAGIQVGGYEQDLTQPLTTFFQAKGLAVPQIVELIHREKIYTDCSDRDNFRQSMEAINQLLAPHGVQMVVLEDFVYCDCQYTLLLVDSAFADEIMSQWQSDSFQLY